MHPLMELIQTKIEFLRKKNQNNSEESTLEIKENKNIDNIAFSSELERAFQMYLLVRKEEISEEN